MPSPVVPMAVYASVNRRLSGLPHLGLLNYSLVMNTHTGALFHFYRTGSPILCVICFMLVYVPMLAVALWSNVLDYALFAAFHTAASRIIDTNCIGSAAIGSTPTLHRRHLGGGVWRLRRWRYKQPSLLLPPDSCELPKRRLGGGANGGGVNEAMEGSVSPASPTVSAATIGATKRRLSAIEMEEKGGLLLLS